MKVRRAIMGEAADIVDVLEAAATLAARARKRGAE